MTKTVSWNASLTEAFERLPTEEKMLAMARAAVVELNRLEKGNQTANFSTTNEYRLVGPIALPDTHVGILSSASKIPKVAIGIPSFPLSSGTEVEVFEHFGLHSTTREIGGERMYILREVRKGDADEFEHTDYRLIDGTRRFAAENQLRGGGLIEL